MYRILHDMLFMLHGATRETVTVRAGTVVHPIASSQDLAWHHVVGIRRMRRAAEQQEPPEEVVVFEYARGPRIGILGQDLQEISGG